MSSAAYRDGWNRIFNPPRPVEIVRNPFNLRPGLVVHYEVPCDFRIRDLARLTRHLATMANDWEPEHGLPELSWPIAKDP